MKFSPTSLHRLLGVLLAGSALALLSGCIVEERHPHHEAPPPPPAVRADVIIR